MKVERGDYKRFKKFLEKYAAGDSQRADEAVDAAREILEAFVKAEDGIIGRTCACGRPGEVIRSVQPISTWPMEEHVFCKPCAALVDGYIELMRKIINESM